MTSQSYGAPTPERRFVRPVPTPTVDSVVRSTYRELLTQSVPSRLTELVTRYGENHQHTLDKEAHQDGSED
jgi:hypothetical protein